MLLRTLSTGLAGLILLSSSGSAQQPTPPSPEAKKPGHQTTELPDQIRQRLAAQGYSDIKIEPASYLVSATDKEGNSFVLLIGPDAVTMLSMEKSAEPPGSSDGSSNSPSDPSIAEQQPDTRDKLIFQ